MSPVAIRRGAFGVDSTDSMGARRFRAASLVALGLVTACAPPPGPVGPVVASAATVATTGSLQAARRNVEPMLGAVVGSKEATRLRSYLRQLIASPEGRQQLAQLASASPFAAYQQRDEMFCLSYDHVFADAGPSFLAIGDGGRCLPLLWPTPRGGGVRCVHLRYDDEAFRRRTSNPCGSSFAGLSRSWRLAGATTSSTCCVVARP